jgi:hypothetical protein
MLGDQFHGSNGALQHVADHVPHLSWGIRVHEDVQPQGRRTVSPGSGFFKPPKELHGDTTSIAFTPQSEARSLQRTFVLARTSNEAGVGVCGRRPVPIFERGPSARLQGRPVEVFNHLKSWDPDARLSSRRFLAVAKREHAYAARSGRYQSKRLV